MEHENTRRPEFLDRMAKGNNLYRTSAFAIKVGDQWFAGFGGKKGAEITKFRNGLCDAKLISGSAPQKVQEYIVRLEKRGYFCCSVSVSI